MPSVQRGTIVKRGKTWTVRYYDADGVRRSPGGFKTRTEAADFLQSVLDEVEALRRGEVHVLRRRQMPTLAELVEEFLGQHNAEQNTLRTLKARLDYALRGPSLDGQGGFADIRIDRLEPRMIGAWRKRLPERSAYAITKALRQVLAYAVRAKLVDENVAKQVPNPEPKRREIPSFNSLEDLEAIGDELAPERSALPVFGALTGLRPEEWIGLERRDVDHKTGLVHVRRVFTDGQVKAYGKQSRSLRAVPLPAKAIEALGGMPTSIGPLLFPGTNGKHLNLHAFRADEWTPAVRAAGIEHRTPYALRHTYATFAIASGVSLFELARFMGTSVEQIDERYGHLLPDSHDRARTALDAFLAGQDETYGRRLGAGD